MSKTISFLKSNPLLLTYAKEGLVNINALSDYIKKQTFQFGKTAAIAMEVRRYLLKQTPTPLPSFEFSQYKLQVVTRSFVNELIFPQTEENREHCISLVSRISHTKFFVSFVSGEKEMVIITDMPKDKIGEAYTTEGLGFLSINFPIELRSVPGVYFSLTSLISGAGIAIHSFHTIGGEILILVKNEDLLRMQEVLDELI